MTTDFLPAGPGPGTNSSPHPAPRLSATARAFATVIDHPWLCLLLALGLSALAATGYRDPGWAKGAWNGTWWQADPSNDLILIYLIQNYPDLTSAAAAVSGNTALAKLQSVQPKFVRRTYSGLGL